MRQIRTLGRCIARAYQPQRIILFGSYAWGTPTPDSDVDLLVILPFEGRAVDKAVEMRLKLDPRIPMDLIVRTPKNVSERLKMGDGFLREVLEKGKVLYEANNR